MIAIRMALLTSLLVFFMTPAPAQAPVAQTPGPIALILTYRAAPAQWLKLRGAMASGLATRLAAGKRHGELSGFTLFYNRDVDAVTWSGMAIVDFASEQQLARFRRAERDFPACLTQSGLALTQTIETTESVRVRAGGDARAPASAVYLIIPYRYTVSAGAYGAYLDGYTIPQLKGWVSAGILARYDIYMAQYEAGRPWSALLVLAYRDGDALAARDTVKAQVRAALSKDPGWAEISASKAHIREELPAGLAELLADGQSVK